MVAPEPGWAKPNTAIPDPREGTLSSTTILRTALAIVAAATLGVAACGSDVVPVPEATGHITELHGAMWAAPVAQPPPTLDLTVLNGTMWAAFVPDATSTLGTTEMIGAFTAAP
jgi:hypothetical protein